MTDTVHVLVYDPRSNGVCDYYRRLMYTERLARLGVEMKTWSDFDDHTIDIPAEYADHPLPALVLGLPML